LSVYRAHLSVHRARVSRKKYTPVPRTPAVYAVHRALMRVRQALLSVYRTLLHVHRALLRVHIVSVSVYRAVVRIWKKRKKKSF